MATLATALANYPGRAHDDARHLERARELAAGPGPWDRSSVLHATASAIVVHPGSRRLLLRWHERMNGWLQVGGHADPGESDPFAIARREAREETGLSDLASWPDTAVPRLVQVVIVQVPAGRGEREHEHADLRYVLATARPDDAAPESQNAALRWLPFDEGLSTVAEDNLRECLHRVAEMVAHARFDP